MKIPCEDCICLPICRQENKNLDTKWFWIKKQTYRKCSLVQSIWGKEYRKMVAEYLTRKEETLNDG